MTKTTTKTTTGATEPTPPWKSQKIWAMVIGVALVAVLFAFGREVEACALAAMVGAFVLGRGLERLGAGVLLVVALGSSACAVTQAQVAVQTSLTGIAEGVHAGDEAIALAVPRLHAAALADARTRCAVTQCQDPLALYAEEMAPVDDVVDGLEVAGEALRVAQAAQDAWVASDQLPDAGPLCGALGDAVRPVAGLLDEAGVDAPPGIAGAGGVVEVICGVVARWATQEVTP